MLYREIMAVCSEIHTKPTNTPWLDSVWWYTNQPFGFQPSHNPPFYRPAVSPHPHILLSASGIKIVINFCGL